MKLYLLFGNSEGLYGEEFRYFYGCFSTKEKANDIRKNLEEKSSWDVNEEFEVEEHILDEPTDLYDFIMEP